MALSFGAKKTKSVLPFLFDPSHLYLDSVRLTMTLVGLGGGEQCSSHDDHL
jgi:hypothetical protein